MAPDPSNRVPGESKFPLNISRLFPSLKSIGLLVQSRLAEVDYNFNQ